MLTKDSKFALSSLFITAPAQEDRFEVILVAVRIVSVDLDNLRNEASAGTPFELHHDVERMSDICFYGAVWKVNTALKHTAREARSNP